MFHLIWAIVFIIKLLLKCCHALSEIPNDGISLLTPICLNVFSAKHPCSFFILPMYRFQIFNFILYYELYFVFYLRLLCT